MRKRRRSRVWTTTARSLLATVILAAAVGVASPPAALAAPGWTIDASPGPPGGGSGDLTSVTCPSTTTCFAVGADEQAGGFSLIERWDGTAWSVMPDPDPLGVPSTELTGVACISTVNCFAVGESGYADSWAPLIEHWDGTAWTLVASATPPGLVGTLNAIACPSATTCFAVGFTGYSTTQPVVAQYDGTSWSYVTIPALSTVLLTGIGCANTSSCFAVGSTPLGAPVIAQWNGTTWSVDASPTPTDATSVSLSAVACESPTSCFAAGAYATGLGDIPMIEHWDGTAWSLQATPMPPETNSPLNAVSCAAVSDCYAVGLAPTGSWIAHWDGTRWTIVPSPANSNYSTLNAVTCTGPSACFAVGNDAGVSDAAIVEQWDGTSWARLAVPIPLRAQNVLSGVTCVTNVNCFAVGSAGVGDRTATLVDRWNGRGWSIATSQNPPNSPINTLAAVACATSTRCFAVGQFQNKYRGVVALIERWDGSRWVVFAPPLPAGSYSVLTGITCPSATRCFAVGVYETPRGKFVPLTLGWNGKVWSIQTNSIPPSAQVPMTSGVACTDVSDCFLVASIATATIDSQPIASRSLIERWNGGTWALVTSANPGGATFVQLAGVSCAGESTCFAAGSFVLNRVTRPFVEQWNGKHWTVVTGLNPAGASAAQLSGVACASASRCIATGSATTHGVTMPLVERWNGTHWTFDTVPVPSATQSAVLIGATCVATDGCFAVGDAFVKDSQMTLIEHHA